MSEIHFDEQVDITDVLCPVTFVKAKVEYVNCRATSPRTGFSRKNE